MGQVFLLAIYESAQDARHTIDKLIMLHEQTTTTIEKMRRATKTEKRIFAYLESNSNIEIQKTAEAIGITFKTINGCARQEYLLRQQQKGEIAHSHIRRI
jgi:hypothetical protein